MRVLSPALRLLLLAAADAFSPISIGRPSTINVDAFTVVRSGSSSTIALNQHIGSGGMADTRNPDTIQHEDPRKSISAAPSFEEYLKQRANEGTTAATAPPKPIAEGDFDATAAISAMETSQTKTVGDIASAIPDLAPKPDQSYAKNDGFTAMGNAVSLQASDAPGPANVAWISDLSVDGALSSLTIFNGPLSDVPHLIQRCFINEGMLHFFLDVRPRAYGAHDLRDADGNYPGPETLGRKAFEYSGARKDYDTKFGTEELISLLDDTVAKLEGVTKNPGLGDEGLSELEKVTLGPLAVDISMPLTSGNVDSIIGLREKVASMWLGWATDDSHAHRPGAPVNSQYVYDTKYRQNCYGALLDKYVGYFGQADGAKLAAADSGPLDEAYVGGGS
mmetsp:Transcript_8911/g.17762  ORF Transcript_8911/g.17762 Transcript_8911/m.17762 type:complete len:392 (-) Transcript_8911:443-1618(-)